MMKLKDDRGHRGRPSCSSKLSGPAQLVRAGQFSLYDDLDLNVIESVCIKRKHQRRAKMLMLTPPSMQVVKLLVCWRLR